MPRCNACGQMDIFVHEKTDRTYALLKFEHGEMTEVYHHVDGISSPYNGRSVFREWLENKGEINFGPAVACGICGSTSVTNEEDCKHTKILHYKNKLPRCAQCGARLYPEEGL